MLTAGLTVFLITQTSGLNETIHGFQQGLEIGDNLFGNDSIRDTEYASILTDSLLPLDSIQGNSLSEPDQGSASDSGSKKIDEAEMTAFIQKNITKFFNVVLLIQIPFISLASFLFFRRDRFFYAEHLAINTYIAGAQNILFLPVIPFFLQRPTLSMVYLAISVVYQVGIYIALFSGSFLSRISRGIGALILGMGWLFCSNNHSHPDLDCGVSGRPVMRIAFNHIGGQGEIWCPAGW